MMAVVGKDGYGIFGCEFDLHKMGLLDDLSTCDGDTHDLCDVTFRRRCDDNIRSWGL
jgi:hypothetical protein